MLSSNEVARWGICGHKHWEDRASARPRTMGLQLQQGEGIRWREEVRCDFRIVEVERRGGGGQRNGSRSSLKQKD